MSLSIVAIIVVVIILVIFVLTGFKPIARRSSFWTRYSGAIPKHQQARRTSAAEKGVPDVAWAVAYWPPRCA